MSKKTLGMIRTSIILSIVVLCLSGSFSAIQYLPTVQGQTQASTSQPSIEELNVKMAQISSSNKPEDIATLAYIWGFPLVSMQRQFNFVTSPNVPPGVGRGPANTISCARDLINASYTDVVSPNSDTVYCQTQFNLKKGPVVLVAPPIKDRYYTFEFLDAYTNVFAYVGTRATGETGVLTLLLVPNGMDRFQIV
jgi:hypothetical protein